MIRPRLAFLSAAALLGLAHPLSAGAGPVAQAFVPITSCRAVDTRGSAGPNGGPALGANEVRVFTIAGACGVPANALGLVVNLTVVDPAAFGYAQLFAGDAPVPATTVLGFNAHRTRAGLAFVALGANGSGTVALANGSAGGADYILDVEGYFVLACTSPITVTNPATAAGAVSAPFSQTFTSSGGVGAKTYTTASPLPAGLTLAANGTLSGTPTQPGTFPITVTATDQNGCTGTGPTYTLVIACQSIAVTNPGVAAGTANTPFSQTFTQAGGAGATTFSTVNALPVGMTLAANGVLSGTPTQAGGFDIVVKATDANGCTGAGATYHLVINCQTIAVTNPATASGTVNAAFSQTFTQSGAIGAATFSTVSPLPTGLTLSASGLLSGTPTQKGTFPIVVKVTDGNLCTGTAATYNLAIGCQVITVVNPATTTATANTPFSQTFTATNTVGTVTFATASTLPTGLTLAASGVLSGTPTQTGSFPIVVTATDANGCAGASATYTLAVGCQTWSVGPATLPQATTGVAYPGVTFTHSGGIGSVTFTESGALPNGITFAAGVLSGTPTQSGSYPITVTATDSNGCATKRDYLLVVVCSGTSITLSPSTLPTVAAGSGFPSTTFTASGGTGPYSFQEAGVLPAGMSFTTDTLSGTPTQTGTFPITVSAIDSVGGCVGSRDYVVTVTCVGVTITVAPPTLASGPVGTAYGPVTFTASGGTSPYTFAKTGALPPGMTFAAGVLSGTPTAPGSFPIAVTATDAAGCVGATSYGLVTTCPTITVTNPSTTTGTAGTAFSQTFTQSGGSGAVTFSTSSPLPTGLTLSSAGVLSGTTTQTGSFPIVVKATDANGCTGTGATYTLVIACQAINVTNPGTATGTAGVAFDQPFTATGYLGTLTWSTASTLPTGLTLNSAGHLSGTPTQTGSFPIVVKATDTNGCFGTSATYTLVVTCPTITVIRTGGGSFPAGAYGTAYISQSVAASGSAGTPFTFAVTAGALPGGLALATGGAISGTPTATGVFSFTVTATDQYGCTGSQAFSISVAPKLTAKAYTDVANTQLAGGVAAPATPSVSVVALSSGDTSDTTITYAVTVAPTHGALTTFNANGTFLYTPSVGNTTSDSFTYTGASNGVSATQTATIAFSGKVWYVDNATASGTNDGRSNTPFKTMTAVGTAGTGTGDFIYVAKGSGSTTGAYTMLASQQLIGAGATLNVPTVSPILTVAGNAANTPTLSGTLTLASSVVVNGIDMSTGSSTSITGTGVTGINVTARSVSSSGAPNGIFLNNMTGSFTVTGDGVNTAVGGNGSGGTISNATGADGATAGSAIYLNNVQNVTLRRITINGTNQNYAIRGNLVNGFTLEYSTVAGTNGTAASLAFPENYGEGSIYFGNVTTNGLSSSGTFTNNLISGGRARNVSIVNTVAGTTTLTFKGNTFGLNQNFSDANQSLAVEARNAGTIINSTVGGTLAGEPNTFTGAPSDLANFTGQTGTTMDVVMKNNAFSNNHAQNIIGGGGLTLASQGVMTFNVDGNTLRGADGSAITLFKASAGTSLTGILNNNTIGVSGVSNSGSKSGNGIFVSAGGTGTMGFTITNNTIVQIAGNGHIYADNTGGSYSANFTIKGNLLAEPGAGWFAGIAITNGSPTSTDTINVCATIGGSTGAEKNTLNLAGGLGVIVGASGAAAGHTFNLPSYAGGASLPNVKTFIQANNAGSFTTDAYVDAPATAAAFTGVGSSCPTP